MEAIEKEKKRVQDLENRLTKQKEVWDAMRKAVQDSMDRVSRILWAECPGSDAAPSTLACGRVDKSLNHLCILASHSEIQTIPTKWMADKLDLAHYLLTCDCLLCRLLLFLYCHCNCNWWLESRGTDQNPDHYDQLFSLGQTQEKGCEFSCLGWKRIIKMRTPEFFNPLMLSLHWNLSSWSYSSKLDHISWKCRCSRKMLRPTLFCSPSKL